MRFALTSNAPDVRHDWEADNPAELRAGILQQRESTQMAQLQVTDDTSGWIDVGTIDLTDGGLLALSDIRCHELLADAALFLKRRQEVLEALRNATGPPYFHAKER
jgi:hypothetical protein